MNACIRPFIILTFLVIANFLFADIVSEKDACLVAKNFYWQQAGDDKQISYDDLSATIIETRVKDGSNLIHIIDINQRAFVIISAWDGTVPVLGFSSGGAYPENNDNFPPAYLGMMAAYESQVHSAITMQVEATPGVEDAWINLLNPPQTLSGSRSVDPLLTTVWNQSCYYNELCPEDNNAPGGYCGHVPAGCVALAMAQVMKYWDYPVTGTGSHSYYTPSYGWQSADFGNTTYEWDNMPNSLGNSNLSVATLIYHCAVGVDMQFGPDGSGAYTGDALAALENYFNYDPEGQFYNKNSFTDEVWESMLRDELDLGRPVIYRGQGSGGHAWVCDGYAADDYFHMNWGWGGYANGYFYLSNLNPAGQNFNYYQSAIMNIIPGEAVVEPPQNLEAVVNGNDIELSWMQPFEPQWVHWDNGSTSGVLSIAGGGSFDAAARWAPGDLEAYDDLFITKVSVYLGSDQPQYELKIWTGEDAANLVYSEPVNNMVTNSWNTIELSGALQIDAGTDLYIGISVIDQPNGESAIGRDSGPAVEGRGGMISFNGNTWAELNDYGLNFNWNIQAFINTSPGEKSTITGKITVQKGHDSHNRQIVSKPIVPAAIAGHPGNRDLLGYNVYRDDIKINENVVPVSTYTDEDLNPGTYQYYVTSVYNAGESSPSNTASASTGLVNMEFNLDSGWNSISSLMVPADPDVESICAPVLDQMVIMQNMNAVYCPDINMNTIGQWDFQSGYLIKVGQGCTLPFEGLTNTNRTLTLNNGWNLIPVLSGCEVNTKELFSDIVSYIRVVKDAAGTGVYWPAKDINTLPVLEPGKAYFVKIFSTKSITFPACE